MLKKQQYYRVDPLLVISCDVGFLFVKPFRIWDMVSVHDFRSVNGMILLSLPPVWRYMVPPSQRSWTEIVAF